MAVRLADRLQRTVARSRPFLASLRQDRSGVTAIEYALIGGLIAVVIVAVVTTVGTDVSNLYNSIGAGVQNAATN